MNQGQEEVVDVCVNLLLIVALGGIITSLFFETIGATTKVSTFLVIFLLLSLGIFFSWRFIKAGRKTNIVTKFKSRRPSYTIKKLFDEYDLPDILKQYDFCILETRKLDASFQTMVYVRDINIFNGLVQMLKWEILDPMSSQCTFVVRDMSFKEISEILTDILGDTLIRKEVGK